MTEINGHSHTAQSWVCEANDGSGFARNGLRFATKEEADKWGSGLMWRWLGCKEVRSVQTADAVNARYEGDTLVYLEQKKEGSNAA